MTVTNFETSKQIVILCDLCFQEITNVTRIKCECQVDICISCFYSTGKRFSEKQSIVDKSPVIEGVGTPHFSTAPMFKSSTLKNHTPLHRYYCIEPLNYTILDPAWTALEELIFFEMLIQHGIGNWHEISQSLKTKTAEEIEKHFYLIFTIPNDRSHENKEKVHKLSNPNNHIVSVYAPKRRDLDFEDEFDHELNLKFLDYTENTIIKDFLLSSYRNLLLLRKIKKAIIFEKRLTEINLIKEIRSKLIKYDKLYTLLAPLCQFISRNDFNIFFNGLKIEMFLLNFNGNSPPKHSDTLSHDYLRQSKLSQNELDLIQKLNITYSTYCKFKTYAVMANIHSNGARKISNAKKYMFLLKYFKKKKIIL